MYDLIIIGARVSGSSTALLSAKAGLKVLLIDRHKFPSDTLSTNYIHQPGCLRLKRWGVLDKIIASGTPAIPTTRFQADDIVIKGGISKDYEQINAYAPRRYVLDSIMAEAAKEAGVELRENCSLLDIKWEDGRCSGVKLRNADKKITTESAALIVGADGMRSTVARLVGSKITHQDPLLTCAYYSFWEGLKPDYELYEGKNSWVGAVPTTGSVLVATYFPQNDFNRVRKSAMAWHMNAIETTAPNLFKRLKSAKQSERLWGTGDQQNFFRQATGPGWALVGDAGHHKDSITARGITDALVQSELLVSRVKNNIHDQPKLNESLQHFAKDRDMLMMPGYKGTLAVAKLEAQNERISLLRSVADNTSTHGIYFDVIAGIRSATELEKALNIKAKSA
ncbi:MAG: NAD(P)/FAD-dependent oxidoreductase [Pseudomonadota bacterium]